MAAQTNPLGELLVDQLKDLYSAENQIIKALPKMAKAATSPDLKRAFERHLEETRRQVDRLNQIGETLGVKLTGKKCKGMEGLIEEGKEVIEEGFEEDVLDAGLIGAAQKVEHYEIAGYGTARTHAEMLGHSKVARLLQQTLDEEGAADKKLTQLAESVVNVEAATAD
jgi:ferritin-like metal-binding protein YciE